MKPRILLADDHKIVLDGLRSLLAPDFEIVGAAADGRQLVQLAQALQPDVVVADISMPLLNGIDAARQLPGVKFVFLTMHPDPSYLLRALQAGALGYDHQALTRALAAQLQSRGEREASACASILPPGMQRRII